MRKTAIKDYAKSILATGLIVGLFGSLLVGISNYALAASMTHTVVIPTTYQGFQIRGAAADYVKGNYVVIENKLQPAANPANSMTASEAAELGAQYLWDMFGVNMDGKAVSMMCFTDPGRAVSYWNGDVYDSESDARAAETAAQDIAAKAAAGYDVESLENELELPCPKYTFSINAVTGERNDAQYHYEETSHDSVLYKFAETDNYYKNNNQDILTAAKAAAARQLPSEPVLAAYVGTSACFVYDGTDIPESGEAMASYIAVEVLVTDANGNQAGVFINTGDLSLLSIFSIYQGVNYAPESLG